MVVGFGRIEGHPVGIIANQARYLGGVLDAAASDKGASFVNMCDRYGIPLVVLSDTPGYRPGVRQEREAVLRRGAELLRAFSVAEVPRVTVTLRQAYGGAYIVMNCRDLGNDLCLAWPNARIGVMGAPQAVEIVKRRDASGGRRPGRARRGLRGRAPAGRDRGGDGLRRRDRGAVQDARADRRALRGAPPGLTRARRRGAGARRRGARARGPGVTQRRREAYGAS